MPFHRCAYELVVRCTATDIPAGELKRRLDRMVKRFLNRHTPAPQEHFNVQASDRLHWAGWAEADAR